jgi:hypothetical protein
MTAATHTTVKAADKRAAPATRGPRGNEPNKNTPIKVDYLEVARPAQWSCWYIPAYRARASGVG